MTEWLKLLSATSTTADAWRSIPAAEWAEVIQQADRHQLTPLLYHRLQALNLKTGVPAAVYQQLRHAYLAYTRRSLVHEAELAAVLKALQADRITPVVFKGAELAHTVYPSPACRPMGDIDLWLSVDDIAAAQRVLEKRGYVQRLKPSRPITLQAQRYGEIQLLGRPPLQGLIELHWGVFPGEWLRRAAQVNHDEIWARRVAVTLVGQPVYTLAPEDRLLQLAVHQAISHQMSKPFARATFDLVLVARHQPITWDIVVARARAWRIASAAWLALTIARDVAGLTDAESTITQLAPPRWRRWLIGRFVNPRVFIAGRNLTTSPLRLIFLLLLTDNASARFTVLGRALWPEPAWLVQRYGQSNLPVRLRHLANVLRGRV